MAEPNILESYLVSLSMKGPSTTQQREAEKAFDALASAVSVIVPTITAAATAVVYATDKIAAGLSKLYFESQKTGATVRELTALGYAFEQNGSTLEKFTADFDKFAQTLRDMPGYKNLLRDQLGLKPEDFKDDLTTYSATLKSLAEKRAAGDTQSEGAFRKLFGFDEDNIVARGRKEFEKFYAEGYERNKGIDEESVKALSLVRSLNAFGAALEAVGHKVAAELFDKYGIVLDDMTKWVDAHSGEIVSTVGKVVDQFVQVWKDIEPIAVPAAHKIADGLEVVTVALDRILGSPDGQHGGLHAIRYVLDALAIYIAGKWALKLLGMLGLRGIGGAALGAVGIGGAATVGAVGALGATVMPQPLNEGEDEPYRQAHPGWTPDKPKDPNWKRDAGAPPLVPQSSGGDIPLSGGAAGREDSITGMNPDFKARLQAMFRDAPAGSSVFSGYRSQEKQDELFAKSDRSGHMVARHSHHTAGDAADLKGNLEWFHEHAAEYGLHFPMSYENWHIQADPNTKVPVPQPPAPPVTPPPEHQSFLAGAHHMLASLNRNPQTLAMLNAKPISSSRGQWARTNNIGSRKQVTNIQLASTDPHTAASEIARHMKALHAGTMKSLDRLA